MANYGRDFQGSRWAREPVDRERGYDANLRPRGGRSGRGGYGGDYRGGRRGDYAEATWGSDLGTGYSDYSSRGPYGGFSGAWDLRPQSAGGYDAELRNRRRQRGYDRDR
ncbi:MAG: hypothetical protein M3418_03740 [Gemmatimonadota bacterium]|nr:hypothetical protein [Gemmatimonadota bacterium]